MAESPATMRNVEYIQRLLDLLVEKEIHQTETLTTIHNEILTAIKGVEAAVEGVEAAIKGVENAVEGLHSTYLTMHEGSTEDVPVGDSDQSPELRLTPLLEIPTQGRWPGSS